MALRAFAFLTGLLLGKCKTTAAQVRSGTVALDPETPHRGVAKLALQG
jgi:hypothetical protein